MKTLIVDDDIFSNTGGGQTAYRKLIAENPGIDFVYFSRSEPADAIRPANAACIPVNTAVSATIHAPPFVCAEHSHAFVEALRYATAVRDQTFDVIDCPDYKPFGRFLRQALGDCGVQFRGIALALHGLISDSTSRDWASFEYDLPNLRDLERAQFKDADARYAISEHYAEERRALSDHPVDVVDPQTVLVRRPVPYRPGPDARPRLLCVGRRERRKGNDLALEIAAWTDRDLYSGLRHVGPSSPAFPGSDSDRILEAMAAHRDLPWDATGALSQDALFATYQDRVIVMAPVRYDTFNLVVLEAVAAGVPVAVSARAGVCRYLDALDPPPVYIKIDPDRPEAAARELEGWLSDYDTVRSRAMAYAERLPVSVRAQTVRQVYERVIALEPNTVDRGAGPHIPAYELSTAPRIPPMAARVARKLVAKARQSPAAVSAYRSLRGRLVRVTGSRIAPDPLAAGSIADLMRRLPEQTTSQISDKIALASQIHTAASGRCTLWSEVARLERLRGNDLIAAAYDLRCLRLLNADSYARLPGVIETLTTHGFGTVSDAIAAQMAPRPDGPSLTEVLDARQTRLRQPPARTDETVRRIDMRPGDGTPKVSVLVSLYDTGTQLRRFVELISRQTLVRKGLVEFIFVDAASPAPEQEMLEAAVEKHPLAFCYLRSSHRITIQAAWNLALEEARSDYVTCLGVDETLFPTGLEKLCALLDASPGTDWAMATSLVIDVDAAGGLVRDKMIYDRHDAHQDMTFLETTYVSWVGGLYRKSIHDRFGYYDPSFRCAGDTEFKMRVLPHLRVDFIGETLGEFLDYPSARATAGVTAEIEDQLAWYAHRTPAGAARLLAPLPTDRLVDLVQWCAGRRKCYATAPSSDLEFGTAASEILARRTDAPPGSQQVAQAFAAMLGDLRRHDALDLKTLVPPSLAELDGQWRSQRALIKAWTGEVPSLEPIRDNRFEQHSWLWNTR